MKVTTIIIIILSACILYHLLKSKEEGFVLENSNYKTDANTGNDTNGILTDPINDLTKSTLVPSGYPSGTTNARFFYQEATIKDPTVTTKDASKNGGTDCPANSPSYFPTTVLFQVPPVNAVCKTSDTDVYNFGTDSHSVCSINVNSQWFKQGTRKTDGAITNTNSNYGGLTCTEQTPANKNILCGAIAAVCKTSDTDLYTIPTDSTSACTTTNGTDFYKTGTRKDDVSITTTAAKNNGTSCTTQIPATKPFMCGKVNATAIASLTLTNNELPDAFYNFNSDSFSECNLVKNGLWYKRGMLKSDAAITSTQASYGGKTVTQQINQLAASNAISLATKDKRCGPIAALCRTDSENVIGNYNINTTPVSGSSIISGALDNLGKWVTGSWSTPCMNGSQSRTVQCINSSGQVVSEGTGNCATSSKPASTRSDFNVCQNDGSWSIELLDICKNGSQPKGPVCRNSFGELVSEGTGNCLSTNKPPTSTVGCGFINDDCTFDSECRSGKCVNESICA